MRVLLLNQFVPPDPSPTARLLGDVGKQLEQDGHEVVFVGNPTHYHGDKTLFGSRALKELSELARLLFQGWFSPRCERILFLSSPPFLPVIARMISWRHRSAGRRGAGLVHWAMDVYPDVAVALGEVEENSALARITSRLMGWSYRACDTVVALDEDMAERLEKLGVTTVLQAPWPPLIEKASSSPDLPGRFRILYSGNLGRAHDWKTILDAMERLRRDSVDLELIFQGGGGEREEAKAYAEKLSLENVHWLPYVDDDELLPSLLSADVLLATQREETKGCVWPSKLALSVLTGVPIVWIGPGESAVSNWLADQGHFAFEMGEDEAIASLLLRLYQERQANRHEKRSIEEVKEKAEAVSSAGTRNICAIATK